MFNDDAHIAALERVAAFNLADPKGRMDNEGMTEASRREAVERRGLVRMPAFAFLDESRLLKFEREGRGRG